MSKDTKNPFGDGFEESKAGEFVKWDRIGKLVKGIFTESYEIISQMNGKPQKIYCFEDENGDVFRVGSRGKMFDAAMNKVLEGQWVGFEYHSDIPSKKAGNNDFKLIKVHPGQMDEAYNTAVPTAEPPFESDTNSAE